MKDNLYLLDIDYETKKDESYVIMYFKDEKGRRIKLKDTNFKPYFWIISDDVKKAEKEIKDINGDNYQVIETEVKDKKYFEKDVKAIKVYVNSVSAINEVKHRLKQKISVLAKEVDIPLDRRYLIDNKVVPLTWYEVEYDEKLNVSHLKPKNKELDNPKILAFDIETYTKSGRYSKEEKDPIISISLYGDKFQKVITWKKCGYGICVKDEKELILEFIKLVEEYNPDFLSGYFTDGFDFPYLKARAEKHNIDIKFFNEKIKINRRGGLASTKIDGLPHLDIYKFIRTVMGEILKTETFDLSSVAEELIGEKKLDFNLNEIGDAFDKGGAELKKVLEYNLQDSKLVYDLTKKILVNLIELVKVVNQPIYDICRMSYGQLVEWYLVKKAYEFNEICPNRPTQDKIGERISQSYVGAFVYQPKPGLYENIALLDFQSLYPTIMVSHNITTTTFLDKGGTETIPIHTESGKIKKYHFSKEEGFITKSIKEVILQRRKIKETLREKKDKGLEGRSYALKTIANSSYGYMGFFGARWYSKEAAETITAYARNYIQETIKKAQKDFEVIYGDTDSLFLILGKKKRTDVKDFVKDVNKNLPGIMELEVQDFYKRGIFVMKKGEDTGAKKKYALVNDDDEIIIKGFETIRRDWSFLAKEVQLKVLKIILKENSKEKALRYVKDMIKKIRNKDIDVKNMIIQTQLKMGLESYTQIGPHVAVARRMAKQGITVGSGSIIRYIICEGKGQIRDRARIPEECKHKDYDAEYYINNQILPAVEKIFEVLGYSKNELSEQHDQSKLGDF